MVVASRPVQVGFLKLCLDTSYCWQPAQEESLLIGINYKDGNEDHVLKDCYDFSEEGIVVLSDMTGPLANSTPDYENIMWQLEHNFVKEDETNTDYFFVCMSDLRSELHRFRTLMAKRRGGAPGGTPVEEDGQEEFIIPCDALKPDIVFSVEADKVVTDKVLKDLLVKRLGKGSQLIAFFDSCHSGTLLNLKHYRCNRSGDLISLVQDTARLQGMVQELNLGSTSTSAVKKANTMESSLGKGYYIPWKGKIYCHGFCSRLPIMEKPQVVCVSACKDRQNVLEYQQGTMIPAIVKLLRERRNPTYRELMRAARGSAEGVQGTRQRPHEGEEVPLASKLVVNIHRRCCTDEEKDWKQMLRLGCDPQLSSRMPLNTNARVRI
ncbi:hypothetical protein CPB84DRAFT_1745531 [Gymnopilus junonius]|uniref:Uncharacterized protein n=1 Tax=Gymnopilus junonius TaxID=109634 RepID=A0A9P5TPC7_GYMJU|nr:hypothetical protein CPB84DRAFT_1745531 [Gymnopilus junonius]